MRAGTLLAAAAVASSMPLLVLALLHGDGITVAPGTRAALLVLRALLSVLAVSAGSVWVAYAAHRTRHRGLWMLWLSLLAGAAALATPLVKVSIDTSLAGALPWEPARWCWAALSVVLVELAGAGSVWAAQVLRAPGSESEGAPELLPAGSVLGLSYLASPLPATEAEVPAPAPIPCRRRCGRTFATPQAAAGHLRACSGAPCEEG